MTDYYAVLGVNKNASMEDIKRSYRRLAKMYHPDTSTDRMALEKMKLVNQAYDVLGNEEKRNQYDFDKGFKDSGANKSSGSSSYNNNSQDRWSNFTNSNQKKKTRKRRTSAYEAREKIKGSFNVVVSYIIIVLKGGLFWIPLFFSLFVSPLVGILSLATLLMIVGNIWSIIHFKKDERHDFVGVISLITTLLFSCTIIAALVYYTVWIIIL